MKRVTTTEEWRLVYKRGHLTFIMKYAKVFLRDYVFVAFLMLGLIRFDVMEPYSLSAMILQGGGFILLGVAFGELQWFLLKKRFGVPDSL